MEHEELTQDEWQQPTQELSMAEMDALIKELREAKEAYAKKKQDATEAKNKYDNLALKISTALESAGLDKFTGSDGTVSITRKLAVRLPATVEDKKKLFAWLKEHRGEDVADHYMSVNSQALNTLYNTLSEEYSARGEVLDIDGLEPPTYRESLSFRKSK